MRYTSKKYRVTMYRVAEADRLNKSNPEIREMKSPNISRDKELFFIAYCLRRSLQGF